MVEIETHRTEVVRFKLGDAIVGGVAQMQILTILPPPAIAVGRTVATAVLVVHQTRHEAVWLGGSPIHAKTYAAEATEFTN
jgi:hypothetical protein